MPHAIVVPALPVLLPGGAVVLALLLRRLHRAGELTPARAVTALLLTTYGAAVIAHVLLPFPIRLIGEPAGYHWWWQVNVVPLVTADPIGLVLNAALFVPLGLLLPLVSRAHVVRTAFLLSLAIEVTQLVGDLTISAGRVFDVDDLVANTVGAAIGLAACRLLVVVPTIARLVEAATWPRRDPERTQDSPVAGRGRSGVLSVR